MIRTLVTLGLLVSAGCLVHAAPPPMADVRNVPATFHGTVVDDPYRWMEDV